WSAMKFARVQHDRSYKFWLLSFRGLDLPIPRDSVAITVITAISFPSLHPPQHQRGVLGSERDAVAHCVLDLNHAPGRGNVVQVALRIRLFKINGGWKLVVLHRDQRCRHACGSAGALGMPDLRLES